MLEDEISNPIFSNFSRWKSLIFVVSDPQKFQDEHLSESNAANFLENFIGRDFWQRVEKERIDSEFFQSENEFLRILLGKKHVFYRGADPLWMCDEAAIPSNYRFDLFFDRDWNSLICAKIWETMR